MALILHHHHHSSSLSSSSSFFICNNKPFQTHLKSTNLSVKSQQQDQESPSSNKPTGFGSSATTTTKKKPTKGKRERASIIRREPFEKPNFEPTPEQAARAEELRQTESAFQLVWLGLGGVILFQGIALAASGFLPEAWDSLFVKYLYPLFTPTVFLFVAGTVAYGVLKYLQNEEMNNNKPN